MLMFILECVIISLFCHFVGDYVLQTEFLASTKGKNFYHLIIHCALYCIPFYLTTSGFSYVSLFYIICLFISHLIIDFAKTRGKINYVCDQILHIAIAILLTILCH